MVYFPQILSTLGAIESSCPGAFSAATTSEDEIKSTGIALNSTKWEKAKHGFLSGAGKTPEGWKEYISDLEGKRAIVFSLMKRPIRNEMARYNFTLKGLGGGGVWSTLVPFEVREWDDVNDNETVKFEGVSVRYGPFYVTTIEVIMHEYAHGLFDVYGCFAGSASRMINNSEFEADVRRLVLDPAMKDSSFVRDFIETDKIRSDGNTVTIKQATTELFAHLCEIFVSQDTKLPSYITRHFAPFFEESVIRQHTLP